METNCNESPLIDAENEQVCRPSSVGSPSKQRLTARSTFSLRSETVADDGTARTWREATNAFEDYIMSQHAAANTWESDKGIRPTSHRFTVEGAKRKEGKIRGGLRYVDTNTLDSLGLKTIHITRTGWPYDADGRPAPPIDFLRGLADGHQTAMRRLRDVLNGHDDIHNWGRVTVREPHYERRKAYPHVHDGIVVVGDVQRPELEPVIDRYVDANPFARPCDHGPDALTVWDRRASENIVERLANELTNNLVGYEFAATDTYPLTDTSDAVRRFAALMWATGCPIVSKAGAFDEWIERSQDGWEPDDESGQSGDYASVDYGGGGVDYVDPATTAVAFQFPHERETVSEQHETNEGAS